MASPSHITLLLACVLASSFSFSMATRFDVGGKDGWVVKPSESYDHWAQRLRFLVNDSLVFRYKQGSDSVVQVKKEDYVSCDTSKKLKVMKSGTSVFKFTQSGPFYFISGNKKQCLSGQKLVVVVLAVRTPKTPTTPTTPPPPPSSAPALPPTATPPPSGTPKLAPQPPAGASPPPSAGSSPGSAPPNAPAGAPWNSPAGQPGASPPGPPGSPDTADQSSPPVASRNSSSSSSAVAAVAPAALVAVGLGLVVLFM